MDEDRVQPALTPEEWARWPRYDNNDYTQGRGAVSWLEGGCPDYMRAELGAAAMLLHGRITWEMVDALRATVAAELHDNALCYHEDRGRIRELTSALADLLESLLPPR